METSNKRVAIYARVSTGGQTTENQLLDLRKHCGARGWSVVAECVDNGLSGTKRDRPQLEAVLDLARKRRVDILLVWRYDRFARSLPHLVSTLEELRSLGVDFVSHQESVDTSTPQGRMVFGVIASLAEFEREIIRERIFCGLRRAKENGVALGRPNLDIAKVNQILSLRGQRSHRDIAKMVGVGKGTVQRVFDADRNRVQNRQLAFVGEKV